MKTTRIVIDWHETAYYMVQGLKPRFEPSASRPQNLDAVFEAEEQDLDQAHADFMSNKGAPVLSMRAALKEIGATNRNFRMGR
jgi:hypothetical protein